MAEMIRIGYAKEAWMEHLCEIWSLCFGDSITFSRFFFSHCKVEEQVLVVCAGEKPVSMLSILPASTVIQGKQIKLAYLYAVATHPAYQGKGYSTRLLMYAKKILQEKNCVPVLVPATRQLAKFYSKRGFYPATNKKTVLLEARFYKEQIEMRALSADEYKGFRDEYFARDGYVEWPLEEIVYRLEETVFFGGFAKKISYGGREYGILAYIQDEVLYVKESTIPEEILEDLAAGLAYQLQCRQVRLILPIYSKLEGEISLLSMTGKEMGLGQGYMNLVLD